MSGSVNRRTVLKATSGAAAATFLAGYSYADKPVARKGRINQSLVNWCYAKKFKNTEAFCRAAVSLGCKSIELMPPEHWKTLKKHGLTCAIASSHGFREGLNNPEFQGKCLEKLTTRINQAAEAGVPSVITFTGMATKTIDKETGAKNCVQAFKKIVGLAEKKKINLCLEMLNTRDDSHPMKGHPGYQGDDIEYCIDIIKKVGSPRLKLLFDIYHVQIMHGDVIRRIRQHKDYLGHIHTAGNPGRGELDRKQEINYPPIMQALVDVGYKGFVGQEFIPTRDVMGGLKEAVSLCDV